MMPMPAARSDAPLAEGRRCRESWTRPRGRRREPGVAGCRTCSRAASRRPLRRGPSPRRSRSRSRGPRSWPARARGSGACAAGHGSSGPLRPGARLRCAVPDGRGRRRVVHRHRGHRCDHRRGVRHDDRSACRIDGRRHRLGDHRCDGRRCCARRSRDHHRLGHRHHHGCHHCDRRILRTIRRDRADHRNGRHARDRRNGADSGVLDADLVRAWRTILRMNG